jgi:hypothetical protein
MLAETITLGGGALGILILILVVLAIIYVARRI